MAYTDRELLKQQQAGQLATAGTGASDATLEITKAHTRTYHIQKTGTENAATNVAETYALVVNRKSVFKSAKFLTGTGSTQDASNYARLEISKRDGAGGSQVNVASYNTHNSGQGTITAAVPASFSVVANADATIAAGSVLTYTIGKLGSGVAISTGVVAVDLEEV